VSPRGTLTVPREELHLLNPSYISLLVREFVRGYQSERRQGAPVVLVFVAIPLVLYLPVRSSIPRNITSSMYVWTEDHRDLQAAVAQRAGALHDVVRRGVMFALAAGTVGLERALLFTDEGPLAKPSTLKSITTPDMAAALSRIAWIGRWFARAGDPATILLTWGLRP